MTELTYAKAGVTPGWMNCDVIDAETGEAFQKVIEANAAKGWLIRNCTGPDGRVLHNNGVVRTERVERPIRIVVKPASGGHRQC